MAQVYVKYNPYRLRTLIEVNGHEVEKDSGLYKLQEGKRLQEWAGGFPERLKEEINTVTFDVTFCGMKLDWDDFEDAFRQAEQKGVIDKAELKFIEGKSDDEIEEKITQIFHDLQEGPVEAFRDPKLEKAFNRIRDAEFPVNVIATMSSGKSTLINALLGRELMPAKNEACTATITEILDNDEDVFRAAAFDGEGNRIDGTDNLTYQKMEEWNENEEVSRISVEGDIPFLDARGTALMLIDTPGPNNAQNQAHMNTTYRAIQNDANNLILYVLNGTQLSTNDDASLLRYISDQIRKGGKQIRDRFLFVINKMDSFDPEHEGIDRAVLSAKKYLSGYGIEDPQIFPCSAYTALNIRTHLAGVDVDNLTRAEEKKLPAAAKMAIPMVDKFNEYESMYLEQYSTLSPSTKEELGQKRKAAEERGDTKECALIHCGIYSIEAAITAYVKKYAKTKKVKDLVESFEEVLEENKVLAEAKTKVAADEELAKEIAARAAAVKAMIADGKEAAKFKERIEALDPMDEINGEAVRLSQNAIQDATGIFHRYGDTIYSRDEAKRLVGQFTDSSANAIAKMAAELESVIGRSVKDEGEKILKEYQEKLTKLDDQAASSGLDFSTMDLIRGSLRTMQETAEGWRSDESFAEGEVDQVGEVEEETRTYYEKVGQEEEEIVVGSHEEKIGTKRVVTGHHREKTGTRQVRNPKKSGVFGRLKFWQPNYVEEDVYETVEDYGDEDVYQTVLDYKTIMRDVFEERTETIEHFSVKTRELQTGLVRRLRQNLDENVEDACDFAKMQIADMKRQFMEKFEELDRLIAQKYEELEKCAVDQKAQEAELERSRQLVKWIEGNRAELNQLLDM